jgi:hypothetical protein
MRLTINEFRAMCALSAVGACALVYVAANAVVPALMRAFTYGVLYPLATVLGTA